MTVSIIAQKVLWINMDKPSLGISPLARIERLRTFSCQSCLAKLGTELSAK